MTSSSVTWSRVVRSSAFRDKLKKAGYYAEWRQKFGPQAWALLEKYAGPVG
jgi:hypothetical protein